MIDELSDRVLAAPRGIDGLTTQLEAAYGIEVSAVHPLDGAGGRVLRVDLAGGRRLVARIFSEHRPQDRVAGDVAILRAVEDQGYPAERCAFDEPVSMLAGQPVLLTTFVRGKPSAITVEHERDLADLLGRLHALPVPDVLRSHPGGALHHDPLREGPPVQDLEAALSFLATAESLIGANELIERLRALIRRADPCTGLPEALVHPDMVGPNVLVDRSGDLVAIDWTGAGTGPRLASFAYLLWGAGLKPGGDDAMVAAIASGYARHVQLTGEELDRLTDAMLVRPVYFAAWYFWRTVAKEGHVDGSERWWPEVDLAASIARKATIALDAVQGRGGHQRPAGS